MKTHIRKVIEKIFAAQMRRILKIHQPIVVAVAGSVGKTSAKMAIATVLSQTYRVRYQEGNYNTLVSVPFIILGRSLPSLYNPFGWLMAYVHGERLCRGVKPFDIVVVELGTDAPGDIAAYSSLLTPDISVVTAVSEEHMEFFADLSAVAAEELSIAAFSRQLVLNTDDIALEYIEQHLPRGMNYVGYGFRKTRYMIAARKVPHGLRVAVRLDSGEEVVQATVPLVALHSAKAIGAAVAVADLLDVPLDIIRSGIEQIAPPSGRMQLLRGKHNATILDDTYNSSPLAVEAALRTLYDFPAKHRFAILGQMNELGDVSREAHLRIGALCDPEKLNAVITIGNDANLYLAAAAEKRGCKVIRCTSPYAAGARMAALLKKDSVVLAKGSQNGVFAEEAIKVILADTADAKKLVRQSKAWLARKQAQFTSTSLDM